MKLVLIGLRGTGKSTVGRLMAQRLNWQFLDSDVIVQERAGMTIREIFEKHGEPHFRKLESAVIHEIAALENVVIASGGGAVLNPQNVAVLKQGGFVVHLSASPSELWHRIVQDQSTHDNRPKLVHDAGSGLDELKKLMLSRAAVYAESRDVEVIVEGRAPDEVAEAIVLLMRTHGVALPS
jgi:shikimate kinase